MAAPNLSFFLQLIRYEKELKQKDGDAQNMIDSIMKTTLSDATDAQETNH